MPRRRNKETEIQEAASDRPGDGPAASLLKTKLSIPCPRSGLVSRNRLVDRLNGGLSGRLTLVSAPAGFGKTTLLAEWTCQTKYKVCSVSLDENDNSPSRFWSYFLGALRTLDPNLGEAALNLLIAQKPLQHSSPDSFLTPLVNEISALKHNVAVILDDYHLITNSAIHEGISFFLDNMPPQIHLVVTSRADPPLPLSRLRARNQLNELRAGDLRFTSEEAAAFLDQVMGLRLSPENIAALEARTEGWVVGLQFAGLSMQGRNKEKYADFIAAFTGSHRFVVDYLADEVFNTQPEHVRRFLLRTSILERLNGALCDAVTGQTDGSPPKAQVILANLERNNLFTIPLDANREWYRYHQLFHDVLRHRLQHDQSEVIPHLHRRASEWFEQNGFANEAMSHALAAQDFERAALLVEHYYNTKGHHSQLLLSWLDALPAGMVQSRPRLSIAKAWATLSQDRLQEARESIGHVEQWAAREDLTITGTRSILGEAAAVRSTMAVVQDDALGIIDAAQKALEYLPAERRYLRGVMKTHLGIARLFLGDLAAARKRAIEGLRAAKEIQNEKLLAYAYLLEGGIERNLGHLRQSTEALRKALDNAKRGAEGFVPIATVAHRNLADLLYEMNDLQAADSHLNMALELGKSWWVRDEMIKSQILAARILGLKGERGEAHLALKKAEDLTVEPEAFNLAGQVGIPTIRQWIAEGFLQQAVRWAETGKTRTGDIQTIHQLSMQATRARMLLALERYEPAIAELASLLRSLEAKPLTAIEIDALVLQSMAFQVRGELPRALECMEKALSLARPEGYIRSFLDEGEAMYALLSRVRGKNRRYAITLLSSFDGSRRYDLSSRGVNEIIETRGGVLIEPLSRRERELIPFLADGLSNREIARKLYISADTVKVHLKHIYNKFGVRNRTQALARARELSLL